MKYLFGSLTLLLISGITLANCPPRFRVVQHTPVVVKKEVIAQFVPVAVYQPLAVVGSVYGGAYVPPTTIPTAPPMAPPVQPASTNSQSDLQLILTALQSMDARLKAVEMKVGSTSPQAPGTPPATPQPPQNPSPTTPVKPPDPFAPRPGSASSVTISEHPAVAILRNKCASCHDAKTAVEKGGGAVLLDGGKLVKWEDRLARKVVTMVHSNRMPPRTSGVTAVTDAEVSSIVELVDSLK